MKLRPAVSAIAGLLAVLGAGQGCSSPSHAATDVIHIEIRHSRFVPASISVRSRQAVHFVVHNADPIDHEFIVGDQATQDAHERGLQDHHDGSVAGEISAPAGAVVTTTYHLGRSGQLLYGCHLPGHWAYGMRGILRVSA